MKCRFYLSCCYFSCLKMYSGKFFNAYFYEQINFKFFCGKERHRQGIIQEFNLGVSSHVSITLRCKFCSGWGGGGTGEGCKPQINQSALLDYSVPFLILVCCFRLVYRTSNFQTVAKALMSLVKDTFFLQLG